MTQMTPENYSKHTKKVEDGGPKNTHTHLNENENEIPICPILSLVAKNLPCKQSRCAWFSFDDDACAILALVRIANSRDEWERERS